MFHVEQKNGEIKVDTHIEVMPESSFFNCFRAYFNYLFIRINQNLHSFNKFNIIIRA